MKNTRNIYNLLLNTASRKPDAVAVVEFHRKWTYHDLLLSTDRAADAFWKLGVRKDDKVAIALRNSAEFIITGLALAKIGAASVPINFMVTKEEEIEFILSDSGAKGVVTQREFLRNYTKFSGRITGFEFILTTDGSLNSDVPEFWKTVNEAEYIPQAHSQQISENDITCLLYTSGTTGNPKGVMLSHYNLISNAIASITIFGVLEEDVFLCVLPMFHTFSWLTTTLLPIMMGCKVVVISHLTPPAPWLHLMGREGVSLMAGVPQLFSVIAKEAKGLKRMYLQYWAFRRTRLAASGAAPLPQSVAEQFLANLKVLLVEGYGLTETSPVVAANTLDAYKPGAAGKPLPGVMVAIIDENGNHMPQGSEGEICVKGPNVTKGYYHNEQATKDLFTKDGWMRSGDVGVIDEDGFIFIRDRIKDMIIIKGLKVFSAQVEAVLLQMPDIAETAVIGIPEDEGKE
ncbi:MAG: AMP-binding protein, partial [Elusimicrobiaceae bacterium]